MPIGSVLLVTGDESRHIYAQYCRGQGLMVTDAVRPEQALPLLGGFAPGVVVTDIVFPDSAVDGKTFIRTLRQQIDPLTSIIVLSGYAREEDREGARRSGADAYLIQPKGPQDVAETILNALTLRRRGRRLPWNWRTGQLAALNTDMGRRHSFAPDAAGSHGTADAAAPPRRRRAHVLLVEDDAAVRDMMALLLESAGFVVSPMVDGGDALAYLKEGGRASVVVLDLMMPRVDGWTFRRAQLADPAIADIPVIVMSACAGASASELHAAATFQKPVDVTEVIGAVRQLAG